MTMTANDFLMGGGTAAAKFETIGTTLSGQITQPPRVEQQKDLNTGEPKFWNDGQPMQQLLVTIQTTLRDPAIDQDNGERTFYIKAKMLAAVREAVRRSGAKGLEVGGTLSITYTGDGEATKRGFNPPKLYSASYTAPSAAAANDFLAGQQAAPAVPQQQPYVAPAQQAAPAAPAAWTPPPGMDPAPAAALGALSPEQRAALGFTS